jgi:hypothetical protein
MVGLVGAPRHDDQRALISMSGSGCVNFLQEPSGMRDVYLSVQDTSAACRSRIKLLG